MTRTLYHTRSYVQCGIGYSKVYYLICDAHIVSHTKLRSMWYWIFQSLLFNLWRAHCITHEVTFNILLTKTTAAQNEDALSYHRVRGLYFLAVIFAPTKVYVFIFYRNISKTWCVYAISSKKASNSKQNVLKLFCFHNVDMSSISPCCSYVRNWLKC